MSRVLLLGTLVMGILVGVLMGQQLPKQGLSSYRQRVDTLVKESVRLDTVYRTRTMRLKTTLAWYDTVRMTDTLVRNDTVFIPRAAADSAVSTCRAVVQTCDEQKANLTARLAIAESTIAHKPVTPLVWAGGIGLIIGLILR